LKIEKANLLSAFLSHVDSEDNEFEKETDRDFNDSMNREDIRLREKAFLKLTLQ
jgi:hypothetical protein